MANNITLASTMIKFGQMNLDQYAVLIDVLRLSSHTVSRGLNDFMTGQGAYDPRRIPSDRRNNDYYEFWMVPANFNIEGFRKLVENFPAGVEIRLTIIINNECKPPIIYKSILPMPIQNAGEGPATIVAVPNVLGSSTIIIGPNLLQQ